MLMVKLTQVKMNALLVHIPSDMLLGLVATASHFIYWMTLTEEILVCPQRPQYQCERIKWYPLLFNNPELVLRNDLMTSAGNT